MDKKMSKNIIIITGASSGIGREFALQMDPYFTNIDEFWLIARSKTRLGKLSAQLRHKVKILAMDITKEAQLERLADTLEDNDAVVRILVNCAGYGLMGDFENMETESALGMIRLNCEALTHVTSRCIPFMRRNSRIIQLASSAAFLPQPGFAVYAATKSYVLSFSRALGEELRKKGIYVTSVCPGPVDTPFFDIAEQNGSTLSVKKYTMVQPEQVVTKALKDSYYKHAKSVYSIPIRAFELFCKCIPHESLIRTVSCLKKDNEGN